MDGETLNQPSRPTITALMAVKNGEKHIGETITSVVDQTFTDFEFLIIDDGSTDATEQIIKRFDDPRIRILKNSINLGLTKSLNRGLSEARGVYIARIDSDDISLPDRFAKQKLYLDAHPDVACIGTASIVIDENGKKIGEKIPPTDTELLEFHMMLKNQIAHPSVMYRASDIQAVGSYDENIRFAQDYDLWSRLIASGKHMANLPEKLIKYRLHGQSITQGESRESAYNFATKITHKNFLRYIALTDDESRLFFDSLHKHVVRNLRDLKTVTSVLSRFETEYLKKNKVAADHADQIHKHIAYLRLQAWRWYVKYRCGFVYKIAATVKHAFAPLS